LINKKTVIKNISPSGRAYWTALTLATVVWVFVWSQIISILLSTGILWSLLGDQLSLHENNILQSKLFASDLEQSFDVIIIGDSYFIDEIRPLINNQSRALEISFPRIRLSNITTTFKALRKVRFKIALVQNLPYFWSNIFPMGPEQEMGLWKAYSSRRFALFPTSGLKLTVEAIKLWAKGPGEDRADRPPKRFTSLQNVWFMSEPKKDWRRLHSLFRKMPENLKKKICWVSDLSRLPEDADGKFIKDFKKKFNEANWNPLLGNVTNRRALVKILQGRKAS